jgi:hypothetical protein
MHEECKYIFFIIIYFFSTPWSLYLLSFLNLLNLAICQYWVNLQAYKKVSTFFCNLAIVLSVLLQLTDSHYPFDIFKLF